MAITPWTSATSLPVKTSTTFGAALAAEMSTLVIRAWANGLRTIARCSIPGRVMLSVQRVRPVISRWSSLRRRSRPISAACVRLLGGGHAVTPASEAVPAACCTARTMLW